MIDADLSKTGANAPEATCTVTHSSPPRGLKSYALNPFAAFFFPPETHTSGKIGGPDRDQTDDLIVANDALYQLSYWPVREVTYWKITARK